MARSHADAAAAHRGVAGWHGLARRVRRDERAAAGGERRAHGRAAVRRRPRARRPTAARAGALHAVRPGRAPTRRRGGGARARARPVVGGRAGRARGPRGRRDPLRRARHRYVATRFANTGTHSINNSTTRLN